MSRGVSGTYQTTLFGAETVRAFVPAPLPSVPPVDLAGSGIVRELTGQRRNRVFVYGAYLDILSEGGEPL